LSLEVARAETDRLRAVARNGEGGTAAIEPGIDTPGGASVEEVKIAAGLDAVSGQQLDEVFSIDSL
jgi:hypothetical protein